MTPEQIAAIIEHTLLRPEATASDVDRLCDEAVCCGFRAVCVNPVWVGRCAGRLAGGGVRVVSVAGFPLGAGRTEVKAEEARRAVQDGASEIDMVIALGWLVAGETERVRDEIAAVGAATHAGGAGHRLKVILEAAALSEAQLAAGCRCAVEGGADMVKTSTGFHPAGGARVEDVRLMTRAASPLGVKAAGGIRTPADVEAMVEAGASLIGTSAGPAILGALGWRA